MITRCCLRGLANRVAVMGVIAVGTACPSSEPGPDRADAADPADAPAQAPAADASLSDAPRDSAPLDAAAGCPLPTLQELTGGCHDLPNSAPLIPISALTKDLVPAGGTLVPGIYEAVSGSTTNAATVGTRQRRTMAILPGSQVFLWVAEAPDLPNPPPPARVTNRMRVEGKTLVLDETTCRFIGNTAERFEYTTIDGGLLTASSTGGGRTVTEYRRRCAF